MTSKNPIFEVFRMDGWLVTAKYTVQPILKKYERLYQIKGTS